MIESYTRRTTYMWSV